MSVGAPPDWHHHDGPVAVAVQRVEGAEAGGGGGGVKAGELLGMFRRRRRKILIRSARKDSVYTGNLTSPSRMSEPRSFLPAAAAAATIRFSRALEEGAEGGP